MSVYMYAYRFREAVQKDMQIALLVDEDVPFLIGDVVDSSDNSDLVVVHWYSPATKNSVKGKWTPDFLTRRLEPQIEERQRDNIIPVALRWMGKGFKRGVGGTLSKVCIADILDYCDACDEACRSSDY